MKSRTLRIGRLNFGLQHLIFLVLLGTVTIGFPLIDSTIMPGRSFSGTLPALTASEFEVAQHLRQHVNALASRIGERNYLKPGTLDAAADYIVSAYSRKNLAVQRLAFELEHQKFENLLVELKGSTRSDEIVVVGAHYDSASDCPGANDDGSGIAAQLELAGLLDRVDRQRTIRFVSFPTHEHFYTGDGVGSYEYARICKMRGDNVVAMFALDTIGYYSEAKNSQHFPLNINLGYSETANFVSFVSNYRNRDLVRNAIAEFRKSTSFPSEGLAAPDVVPGVSWSDHRMFWRFGYPALMITDTALFRYPHYHGAGDKADQLDYERTARVVLGLSRVLSELANRQAATTVSVSPDRSLLLSAALRPLVLCGDANNAHLYQHFQLLDRP